MLVNDMNARPCEDGLYRRIAEVAHGTPRELWRDTDLLGRDVTTAAMDLLPCVDHAALMLLGSGVAAVGVR